MNSGSTAARAPSLWLDPAPAPGPPLEGAVEADVVVVGAGYTGLWTALALRERGADVVVLERDYAGVGALPPAFCAPAAGIAPASASTPTRRAKMTLKRVGDGRPPVPRCDQRGCGTIRM